MSGKFSVACVSSLAVLAFLLLFASGSHVDAATYKMTYATVFSCNGPDGAYGTSDDSCVNDPTYLAHGAGLHADLVSAFGVAAPYSQYETLTTMGTPANWDIATDKEIPDGAYIGTVLANSTLALFGGECVTPMPVLFHMYDCSTDITDTITWDGAISGENLTYGHQYGLPAGCLKYPQHVLNIVGNIKPRARYYGFTIVIDGMPPTQLQFMMFSTEALTAAGKLPQTDFTDDLGYINYTVLDNPEIPADPTSSLDELCTPLDTTTTLYGRTGGQGGLDVDVGPGTVPTGAGTFWNAGVYDKLTPPAIPPYPCIQGDCCGDGVDNDGNTRTDEMCGIVRVTNPAAGTGLYGTSTHLAGGYSESYRDADGDTIANNADECPFTPDTYTLGVWDDADGDHINDACDPTFSPGSLADEDSDGWRNQADRCPLLTALECESATAPANYNGLCEGAELLLCDDDLDQDNDGVADDGCPEVGAPAIVVHPDADNDDIGDDCDTVGLGPNTPDGDFLQDFEVQAVCIGDLDTDLDGWCDATETLLASNPNDGGPPHSTPEYYGTDFAVTNDRDGDTVADAAPQTCDNYAFYDVNSGNPHGGVAPATDDDGDTWVNAADPGCTSAHTWDADADGVVTADPCQSIVAGAVTTEDLRTVTVWQANSNADASDLCLVYNSKTNYGGNWWSGLNDATVTVNAPGCNAPTSVIAGTLADGNEGIQVVWDSKCVDEGESVTITFRTDATAQPAAAPYGDPCAPSPIWTDLGVPLQVDNCPNVANPTQLNSDGLADGGDACDDDDDQDKTKDVDEWAIGSDPKNVCDPANFNLKTGAPSDDKIDVLDVIMFSNAIMGKACFPPDDYLICEATYRSD
jgi:hypothetical protein